MKMFLTARCFGYEPERGIETKAVDATKVFAATDYMQLKKMIPLKPLTAYPKHSCKKSIIPEQTEYRQFMIY